MFTGIVEEIGHLTRMARGRDGWSMAVAANKVLQGSEIGDSIAVNGTCLTVTALTAAHFTVGVSPETRARTNLERLKTGDAVNLERAVTPATRLGGHFVQGHVDGVGTFSAKRSDGEALWLTVQAPSEIMRYVVPKGFICLDGTSLTVVDVTADSFSIMLVAHTQKHVILPQKPVGYTVNIEVDILGKYVEKFLGGQRPETAGLTMEKLADKGFG